MFYITFSNGLLTNNSTWCQNRGCICISSVRRTYGRIHIPATIILHTELFPREEEREDPRRDSSIFFEYSGVSTNTTRTTVFPHAIQQVSSHPVQRNYSTYRINSSSPRNTTTTRLIPCRLLPATAPRASKQFYTAESSYKAPYSIPGPYSTSRLPVILGGRNSILHGSQHPRSPYSSSQVHSYKNSTRRNRILSKRVKYCISNTILRSVCSNLLILVLE